MDESDRAGRRRALLKAVLEVPVILLVSFVLVFGFVRPVVAAPFHIPTESMVPTLKVEDRLLVNKFIYRFTEPDRQDIIVFESVDDPDEDLIKRVVALPGDTVAVRRGHLILNGKRQDEPYLNKNLPDRSFYAKTKVPRNHVFVMGDNRANSYDSRFFGPVPNENLVGEVSLRFWPTDRFGFPA